MSETRMLTIAGFVLAALLIAGLEWAAHRRDTRIPSLPDVCAFAMRYEAGSLPLGRIAVLALWCWVGWHLFAR
ncbi:DUF6186 family protein [Actinokineospora sp.]|uniref:DUF6186 family protein n=1 Tax=Actinokineospora sp. TaxID=1872133 RepID=UPI003D6AECA1